MSIVHHNYWNLQRKCIFKDTEKYKGNVLQTMKGFIEIQKFRRLFLIHIIHIIQSELRNCSTVINSFERGSPRSPKSFSHKPRTMYFIYVTNVGIFLRPTLHCCVAIHLVWILVNKLSKQVQTFIFLLKTSTRIASWSATIAIRVA